MGRDCNILLHWIHSRLSRQGSGVVGHVPGTLAAGEVPEFSRVPRDPLQRQRLVRADPGAGRLLAPGTSNAGGQARLPTLRLSL